jgi:hypothetical protein
MYTHIHTHTHTCTHEHTHTHTHTHSLAHTHRERERERERDKKNTKNQRGRRVQLVILFFQAGANLPSEIMAYLATEDIYALGYALAETIFTTLAQKEVRAKKETTPPLMKQWLREV